MGIKNYHFGYLQGCSFPAAHGQAIGCRIFAATSMISAMAEERTAATVEMVQMMDDIAERMAQRREAAALALHPALSPRPFHPGMNAGS